VAGAPLRAWQEHALAAMAEWHDGPFLIAAAPGAGKTRPALVLARDLLGAGVVARVAVVCPTTPLTRQWAQAAAELGVHLAPDAAQLRPPRDFHGVAVTYARAASAAPRWAQQCTPGTLVIADEAHHLGEELAWGEGFTTAFGAARRRLLLSGTPFRSDASPIPGVRYDAQGLAMPDVRYAYADAIRDGVCRPIVFITYDGTLSWRSGDDVIDASFETVLSTREAARRYRTAISTELPDGLPRILREAHERLERLRREGHRDAAGFIIAADADHARRIAKLLRETTGVHALVVLHTDAQAARKLAAFQRSRDPWIVAVNMVSEGVDIPRLRVGVYATAAKTALIFRQIVGRFVRAIPGRALDPSWLYLPADPVLRDHAQAVQNELAPLLRRRDEAQDAELDEPPLRRETERAEGKEFVPLLADVAPQMTLFGAPAPPPRPARAAPRLREVPSEPQRLAAFEHRALLRDKRHRLVGELRRRDGGTHAEINAWLNRECGIGRVEDATIEQLQRSVELVLRALTRS
jgi:superfamily II DNA or RNA helicase